MTPEELKKIAGKIAKCFALASSDNQAEAEAARRQADALMKKYNLTTGDAAAAQVHEEGVDTGSPFKTPVYLGQLAVLIANAFGCGTLVNLGYICINTQVKFFGMGVKPELAAYTYDVLRRHIARDRKAYSATLKRYKRANRLRKADLFCQAWVVRIARQVNGFAGNEQDQDAIEAYTAKAYGDMKTDNRSRAIAKQNNDWQASASGYKAADDVSLYKPVQNRKQSFLH
jgi:hypothetical protein